MKTKFYYLLLLAILAGSVGALYSCGDDTDTTPTPPPPSEKDVLTVSKPSLVFEAIDEAETVTVETTANTYLASCESDWVEITLGNKSFTVKVREYTEAEAATNGLEDRTASITVKSGNADDVVIPVTQKVPGATVYTLTTDPESLIFEVGETSYIFKIITNASDVKIAVSKGQDWITDVAMMSNVASITVKKLVGTADRTGELIISSPDLDEDYHLSVTQKPEFPIDLAGTWNWTGKRWSPGAWTDESGTMTLTYRDDLGYYVAGSLPEYISGISVETGGISLHVDENNNITSVYGDKLDMYGYILYMGLIEISYAYRNGFCFINADLSRITKRRPSYGDYYPVSISGDNNVLTFPVSGMLDGEETALAFGFISLSCDPITHEELNDGYLDEGGLWRDFVLTRE